MSTLKELSDLYAKKQPKQVDFLTEDAPILNMLPFEESSHSLWNNVDGVTSVTGASFHDIDAPPAVVSADSSLQKIDLSIMGGLIEVGVDKANAFGGAKAYFAKKLPAILRASGQNAEISILHDTLRAYAIAQGNTINAGSSADTNYTMLCVRFVSGEVTGLYSPDGYKNGATLDVLPMNDGAIYTSTQQATSGVPVYGLLLKGYFGFQAINPDAVSAILNINSSNKPTATMIDDLVGKARGTTGNTYIFSHPDTKRFGYSLKNTKLTVMPGDVDMNNKFDYWNTIPWMESYNFAQGTETAVSFS